MTPAEKGEAHLRNYGVHDIEKLHIDESIVDIKIAAFRAGAEATRETDCRAVCEFCAANERAEYYAGEDRHSGGWTHNRLIGRTWCKADSIRARPLPEMSR